MWKKLQGLEQILLCLQKTSSVGVPLGYFSLVGETGGTAAGGKEHVKARDSAGKYFRNASVMRIGIEPSCWGAEVPSKSGLTSWRSKVQKRVSPEGDLSWEWNLGQSVSKYLLSTYYVLLLFLAFPWDSAKLSSKHGLPHLQWQEMCGRKPNCDKIRLTFLFFFVLWGILSYWVLNILSCLLHSLLNEFIIFIKRISDIN